MALDYKVVCPFLPELSPKKLIKISNLKCSLIDLDLIRSASDYPVSPLQVGYRQMSELLRRIERLEDQHIDPDIFEVFIRERVCLDYAEAFLDPEQIDEIDESLIPGYAG